MKISRVDTFLVEAPLSWPLAPYRARHGVFSTICSLLVRIESDRGVVGWGEAPQTSPEVAFSGLEAEQLRPVLIGATTDIDALGDALAALDQARGLPFQESAVEMAMWDLLGRARRAPVYELLGGGDAPPRAEIELAACAGIDTGPALTTLAEHYLAQGFRTLKLKGGRDPHEDLAMIRALRDAVGDRLQLRLDPNMGYAMDAASWLAKALEPYALEFLEQAMAPESLAASAQLRRQTSTPIGLNESITSVQTVRDIIELEAADVLLPDTFRCGRLTRMKSMMDMAAGAGLACVLHPCWDFGIRSAALLHLAASASCRLLASDATYYGHGPGVVQTSHRFEGGRASLSPANGLGLELDRARLREVLVRGSMTL